MNERHEPADGSADDSAGAALELVAARGWTLTEDLTEQHTGEATPVLRVRADDRDALLRYDVDTCARDAYRAFTGSHITPDLLNEGDDDGTPWALVAYLPGTPVMSHRGDPTQLTRWHDATDAVLTAAQQLPHHPAPPEAHRRTIAGMRELETRVVIDLQLAHSGAHCMRTVEQHWNRSRLLHGDLLPPNALITDDGTIHLIDVAGGWGPLEADAGRWTAALCAGHFHTATTLDDAVTACVRTLDTLTTSNRALDRASLFAWTAVELSKNAVDLYHRGRELNYVRTIAALAGRLDAHAQHSTGAPVPSRNEPCPCGSGRKYKRCCYRP